MTSGYAVATLVVFIVSIVFVVHPTSIPTPRPIPKIPINLVTAPILAIALLWATQCLDLAVIRNGIVGTEGVKPYNIVVLFFSLAYIGVTLDVTGIIRAAVFWVSNKGGSNAWRVYLYFYLMFAILSILLGSGPVTSSGTAFLVNYTANMGLDPGAWVIAEFAAINTARMVLFIGNPTNVVICEGLGVNNTTFTAYTIVPFLVSHFCCFIILVLQYREQVPHNLPCSFDWKPQEALLDPVGAWVGSFTLSATIILCLIISFFNIDAWMICLPLASAKFLFDLCWDYYRYCHGIPMLGRGLPAIARASTAEKDQSSIATSHSASSFSSVANEEQPRAVSPGEACESIVLGSGGGPAEPTSGLLYASAVWTRMLDCLRDFQSHMDDLHDRSDQRFPTFVTALPRLPFSFIIFTLSQFVLIEALDHQGWINVFADWLIRATENRMHPTIWLIGVLCVILCNLLGTNIGATILLTRVIQAATLSNDVTRGASLALGVVSNVGGISFTFSASFIGLSLRSILEREGRPVAQRKFAFQNILPLLVTTVAGLGMVSAEMAILFRP